MWTSPSVAETVTELVAGNGKFADTIIQLFPRETVMFEVARVDVGPTEPWGVELYTSLDGVVWDSIPADARRREYTAMYATLVHTGPAYVRLRIINVDTTPTDLVSCNIRYAKDNVSL